MTVSTTSPKLSEVLANVGMSGGSMSDRRVREQLGGRQSNGHSLGDYKGAVTGLYTSIAGTWLTQPKLDGFLYKGYDELGSLPDNPSITFENQPGSPVYRSVKLMGDSPGGNPGDPDLLNDKSMEVICCGKIQDSGNYKLSFDLRAFRNNFYQNVWWKVVVASSSLGYLQGAVNLDVREEQQILYANEDWRSKEYPFVMSSARPYICMIMYVLHRKGGRPSDPPEGVEYKNARVVKV